MLTGGSAGEAEAESHHAHPPITVSVLLCTFNREHLLPGALGSLLTQTGMAPDECEIVIVDDGSTDRTQSVIESIRQQSAIRIVSVMGAHAGIGAARNLAASHATGRWLAFFDDDQIAAPSWLAALLAGAAAADADGAAGRIELRCLEPTGMRLPPTVRQLLGEKRSAKERRVRWRRGDAAGMTIPGTGNALVRRDLFIRLGGFRPELSFGEDREFFTRARRQGARFVYCDAAVIEHLIPPARLRLAYLLAVARKGACFTAGLDLAQLGLRIVALECGLRLAHGLIVVVPGLVFAAARRDSGAVLGRLCSLAYSVRYCASAFLLGVWRAPGRHPDRRTTGGAAA